VIPWLNPNDPFPPLDSALREPNGLLAAGGDLSPQRLIDAHSRGIFPWFNPGEPVLWWSRCASAAQTGQDWNVCCATAPVHPSRWSICTRWMPSI